MPQSSTAAELWLIVARGGLWRTKDVEAALDPDSEAIDISVNLYCMAESQMLRRHGSKPYSYEVTRECKVPRTVTLGALLGALSEKRLKELYDNHSQG